MGVIGTFEPMLGLGQAGIPAPPGTALPAGFPVDIIAQVASVLSLQQIGVYTPWAAREGDLDWDVVRQPPDTNVVVSALTDQAVRTVPTVTFGKTLPFMAVLTDGLPTSAQIAAMWSGTDYKPYETQALYRQDDTMPVPRIYFLHWGNERGQDSEPRGKNLDAAAASVKGRLVFGVQLDYRSTALRQPPAVPFSQALATQLGIGPKPKGPGPGPGPGPGTTPVTPVQAKTSWVGPVLVGATAAVLAFFGVRAFRRAS